MKAKLLLLEPEAARSEIKLGLPAKIGRGDEAKFKLVHPLVSRLHCEIFEQDEQVMVRDLASLNGTFVNQERILDEAAVPSGSILQVGSVKFQVLYGEDFDRAPSPPPKKSAPTAADKVRNAAAKATQAADEEEAVPDNLDELWGDVDAGDGDVISMPGDEDADEAAAAAESKQPAAKPAAKPAGGKGAAAEEKPAAGKPAAKKPAGGEEDDEGLDDFFNTIM